MLISVTDQCTTYNMYIVDMCNTEHLIGSLPIRNRLKYCAVSYSYYNIAFEHQSGFLITVSCLIYSVDPIVTCRNIYDSSTCCRNCINSSLYRCRIIAYTISGCAVGCILYICHESGHRVRNINSCGCCRPL